MNYKDFSVDDFVWDPLFRSWVLHPDEDAELFWAGWMARHPHKEYTIMMAREMVKAIKPKEADLSDIAIALSIQQVLQHIGTERPVAPGMILAKRTFNFKPLVAAAAIFVFICLGAWMVVRNRNMVTGSLYVKLTQASDEDLIETVNYGNKPMTIHLADGSYIILEKNARISAPATFTGLRKRKVYLTGQASFQITRDPSKPFLIYANGLVTKVLGTKFSIHAYPDEHGTDVQVTSGIVSVFAFANKTDQDEEKNKKISSLILTRNQKASYSGKDKMLTASLAANPQPAEGYQGDFNFSGTRLSVVLKQIKECYGIDILCDARLPLSKTFSANLAATTLFQKMDIICKTMNVRYEVIDRRIVISCK